ncbi:MAG: cytochrome c oxidase assembly protein [Rhodospirillaceae bacterium]|jgi:cytochrome c oxidase assembly protein subunit 11|nr:cytochrome c oxidase assembly protein [Rhodospirillaceae bacterium]MBT4219263.1 cytochrome c oxidase assembly protein [Rhodospirillaceae bacterium]MBT4463544.1 cytochrome c oxidase assembly protein [Rhodospirillaceae bacterium]MBT5014662.1 cytochrome c oxidase assembly protein [Rhodospirillaceae bacterium]MBT5308484.1 cytochrome c oxidase assembly protein [Rhodospirillaceae bacterium]
MSKPKTSNKKTAMVLFGIAGGMVGLAFASVPLYQLFCQVTGYGGSTSRVESVASVTGNPVATDEKRMITVRFDSNVNSALPWKFKPAQKEITLPIGSEALAHYTAVNTSDETVIGTATFNVTPYKAGEYFNKVECFCFTEQKLAPGEEASLPVTFFVDPEMFNDPNARDLRTITLSYTFYRDPDDAKRAQAKKAAQTAAKMKIDSRT